VEALAKEAMYSSSRMHSRLTTKEDMLSMDSEADMASYLRRKTAQGRAQYRKGPEDDQQGGKA
jgi:hypothetical protein